MRLLDLQLIHGDFHARSMREFLARLLRGSEFSVSGSPVSSLPLCDFRNPEGLVTIFIVSSQLRIERDITASGTDEDVERFLDYLNGDEEIDDE